MIIKPRNVFKMSKSVTLVKITTQNHNKDRNGQNYFVRSQGRCISQISVARSNGSYYGLNGVAKSE